ncbi:CHC2 zinc finger domain-containing protein [Desulfovibrio sp. OttesenSCG-928-M16]|nr:CHC2 zinc finger domain-containing protein [Desulfovibrio sp. OttesenSCG-928-M16]
MTPLDKEGVRKSTDLHAFYLREFGKLGPAKPNGDCKVRCCFHEESRASLSVNIDSGNYHCYGCGAGGDIYSFVMKRYGLGFSDAIAHVGGTLDGKPQVQAVQRQAVKKQATKKKSELPEAPIDPRNPSRVYPYYGPDGRALYYIYRWDAPGCEKAVRPVHFAADGKIIFGLPPGVKRTLYNLHRVDEFKDAQGRMIRNLPLDGNGRLVWPPDGQCVNLSVTASHVVYLVEGEKCCEALLSVGLCATTSGSANSWRPEFAELLRGKTVIIIPDADEPGETYAAQAAKDLLGVADSVRIMRLEGLPAGGDVADWIEAKGGRI